jgi:hypothetical protein
MDQEIRVRACQAERDRAGLVVGLDARGEIALATVAGRLAAYVEGKGVKGGRPHEVEPLNARADVAWPDRRTGRVAESWP